MNLLVKSFPRFVESDMTVMTDSEKLKIYAGDKHPHEAQSPEVLDLAGRNRKNKP